MTDGGSNEFRHTGDAPADESSEPDALPDEQAVLRGLKAVDAQNTSSEPTPAVSRRDKIRLATYAAVLAGLLLALYAQRLGFLDFLTKWSIVFERTVRGSIMVVFALAASRLARIYFIDRLDSAVTRYNFERVLRMATAIVVVLIVLTSLFANWYTAALSLGLISLILGFALQTPISSLIAWAYILIRVPYRVGDRIQIGQAKGDVISVSYLDTTLWEFGGEYVSTDHPSGRLIKFPNSHVLTTAVYNYSWPLFPYIWNEVVLQLTYQSDLKFVSDTMLAVAAEVGGGRIQERVRAYRQILRRTPVDQLEVMDGASVLFRANDKGIEAILRYIVYPKRAGWVRSTLTQMMIERLRTQPEKVMFPKGAH